MGFGENVIVFDVDMNSSKHIDNKGKYILILGEHSLTAEKNVFD